MTETIKSVRGSLEEGGIRTTFIKAVERATLRSRELGRGPA